MSESHSKCYKTPPYPQYRGNLVKEQIYQRRITPKFLNKEDRRTIEGNTPSEKYTLSGELPRNVKLVSKKNGVTVGEMREKMRRNRYQHMEFNPVLDSPATKIYFDGLYKPNVDQFKQSAADLQIINDIIIETGNYKKSDKEWGLAMKMLRGGNSATKPLKYYKITNKNKVVLGPVPDNRVHSETDPKVRNIIENIGRGMTTHLFDEEYQKKKVSVDSTVDFNMRKYVPTGASASQNIIVNYLRSVREANKKVQYHMHQYVNKSEDLSQAKQQMADEEKLARSQMRPYAALYNKNFANKSFTTGLQSVKGKLIPPLFQTSNGTEKEMKKLSGLKGEDKGNGNKNERKSEIRSKLQGDIVKYTVFAPRSNLESSQEIVLSDSQTVSKNSRCLRSEVSEYKDQWTNSPKKGQKLEIKSPKLRSVTSNAFRKKRYSNITENGAPSENRSRRSPENEYSYSININSPQEYKTQTNFRTKSGQEARNSRSNNYKYISKSQERPRTQMVQITLSPPLDIINLKTNPESSEESDDATINTNNYSTLEDRNSKKTQLFGANFRSDLNSSINGRWWKGRNLYKKGSLSPTQKSRNIPDIYKPVGKQQTSAFGSSSKNEGDINSSQFIIPEQIKVKSPNPDYTNSTFTKIINSRTGTKYNRSFVIGKYEKIKAKRKTKMMNDNLIKLVKACKVEEGNKIDFEKVNIAIHELNSNNKDIGWAIEYLSDYFNHHRNSKNAQRINFMEVLKDKKQAIDTNFLDAENKNELKNFKAESRSNSLFLSRQGKKKIWHPDPLRASRIVINSLEQLNHNQNLFSQALGVAQILSQ